MSKIKPCLWFDGQAEEAANFYVSLLPDSRVNNVARSPADTPSGPQGMVLTVDFTLAGQDFQGLNGGPEFKFNEAISFVDRLRGPGGGRPAVGRADGGRRRARAVWLAQGSLGRLVADRPAPAGRAAG